MTNPQRIVVPLLLLAAAALGVFFLLNQTPPVELPPAASVESVAPPTPSSGPVVQAVVQEPEAQAPIRHAAPTVDGNTHVDAPQGVKGRVVLPNGAPAPGVPVYLTENSMNDPIKVFLQQKIGARTVPLASGTTAADGTFALGVLQVGKACDLRIVSDDHPEIVRPAIKVREQDWFDTGDLPLEVGLVVSGRVIEESTKAGVAEATVFLQESNQAHSLVATPGRERGIATTTDAQGHFRFGNAKAQGLVNLSVEANGYASSQLSNQPLKQDGGNHFLLEVTRGQPIAGTVVDGTGKPLAGLTITASGLSAKTPQTATVTSSRDGTFEFASLREGPYQLVISSPQFAELKSPPVMTGELDVRLVMAQRAFAKLRVLAANHAPIKSYRISLKRFFPNHQFGIGNVPDFADRAITPADYPAEFGGDWAVVRGLPGGGGTFVFQIQDAAHAKTLSPTFTFVDGGPPPEVEATMTLGASITGTVIDDRGKPVADAVVSTDMNGGLMDGSDLGVLLRGLVPEKHTKAQVRTDAQGRFRIGKLAFADYMVRVSHRDFCEGAALGVELASEGQVQDVGAIQLVRGAYVEGTTNVAGVPMGQIKVSITVPAAEGAPAGPPAAAKSPRVPFMATAISDNDGHFVVLKRVPPGTYKVHALREGGGNDLFRKIFDMKETERTVTIPPGQDRFVLDFSLTQR